MAFISILDRLAAPVRAAMNWRAIAWRSSWTGIVQVLTVQFFLGLVLAFAVRLVFGIPNNAVANLLTIGFSLGSALSGPVTMMLWSILFFNISGVILGLIFGVWINSPKWWHAAANAWNNGSTIPGVMFLSMIGAFFIWVVASLGFSLGFGMLIRFALNIIELKASGLRGLREDELRTSAAAAVLPSEAEVRRAIAAADSAGEDGIILRAPLPVTVAPQAPLAPVSDNERSSLYEGLAGNPDDPLLKGLHKDIDPSELLNPNAGVTTDMTSSSSEEATPASLVSVPVAPLPSSSPSQFPSPAAVSRVREQRRMKLETMVEVFIDRVHSEGNDQDVMQDFIRRNKADLMGFSAQDFDILYEIDGGPSLIEASKHAKAGQLFPQSIIDRKADDFVAAQSGGGNFEFGADDEGEASGGSLLSVETPNDLESKDIAPPADVEAILSDQKVAMGKRLTSLYKRSRGQPQEDPVTSEAPLSDVVSEAKEPSIPAVSIVTPEESEGSEVKSFDFAPAGTSSAMMASCMDGEVVIAEDDYVVTQPPMAPLEQPVEDVGVNDTAIGNLQSGGHFRQNIVVDDVIEGEPLDDHSSGLDAGSSSSPSDISESTDIVTSSGTVVPKETSQAGLLPLASDSKDEEMQDDFINVAVSAEQARGIFEALTLHTAPEQVAALRLVDANFPPHAASRAILSKEFVAHIGDQPAANARSRFGHVRDAYLDDPLQKARADLDSLMSRLTIINSRTIGPNDSRVAVIYREIDSFALRLNRKPDLYADLIPDATAMLSLLQVVVERNDIAVAVAPAPAPQVTKSPLLQKDINSMGNVLAQMAPVEVAEKFAHHDDQKTSHLSSRYAQDAVYSPRDDEDSGTATDVVSDYSGEATGESDSAASESTGDMSTAPMGGDTSDGAVADDTDYGVPDSELDVPKAFSSIYTESSVMWERDVANHASYIETIERARRQRDARLAAKASSVDGVLPNHDDVGRFHAEMEGRLTLVTDRENQSKAQAKDLDAERIRLESVRSALDQERAQASSDSARIYGERQNLDREKHDLADRLAAASPLNANSTYLIDNASEFFKDFVEFPSEMALDQVFSTALEFSIIKRSWKRLFSWSIRTREDRRPLLAGLGLDEKLMVRLEPLTTAAHVLDTFLSHTADLILSEITSKLDIPLGTSDDDIMSIYNEKFGDNTVMRAILSSANKLDESRCNDIFIETVEEQRKLHEYSQMPLSEFRLLNAAVIEKNSLLIASEAKCTSLEASVNSYKSELALANANVVRLESGVAPAPGSNVSGISVNDIALSLGLSRQTVSNGIGKLNPDLIFKNAKGAKMLNNYYASFINDKLFFYEPSVSNGILFVCLDNPEEVENSDGSPKSEGDSVLQCVEAAATIMKTYPAIKSWFAIGDLSVLQGQISDKAIASHLVESDFDAVLKCIAS